MKNNLENIERTKLITCHKQLHKLVSDHFEKMGKENTDDQAYLNDLIDRMIGGELDFLEREPESYLEMYC